MNIMGDPFEFQENIDYSKLDAVSYAFFDRGLHTLSKKELIKLSMQLLINIDITEKARLDMYDKNAYLERKIKDYEQKMHKRNSNKKKKKKKNI